MELYGCWQEARRCDRVATELLRIRSMTVLDYWNSISDLLREVETTSRLLRDLFDLRNIYRSGVFIIVEYDDELIQVHSRQNSTLWTAEVYREQTEFHEPQVPVSALKLSLNGQRLILVLSSNLTVILPCLQKTLLDMLFYIDDGHISAAMQWQLLNQSLNDQGEMGLALRFVM